jgi:hypothetical protein
MAHPIFELFLNNSTMMDAEQQLIDRGVDALPELESLFTGAAHNDFGIPYRQLGLPLRCALEVAIRLGPIAKPLEPYLRAELCSENFVAAQALGAIETLEQESVNCLATALDGGGDLSMESAVALIKCHQADNRAVLMAIANSKSAADWLARAKALMDEPAQTKR